MLEALMDTKNLVAIAILVFIGFVFVKARAGIAKMLDDKIDAIRTELDDASKLHEDARALLAEYEKKRSNAASDAAQMVKHAEEEAARLTETAQKDLEDQLARRVATAKERIAQAESKALQEVRAAAVDVAVEAAEKLIKDSLDGAQQKALAQAAIKEASAKLH